MVSIVTDEMVEAVALTIQARAQNGADSPVDYGDAEDLARAALEAVAPLIRKAAHEEAIKKLEDDLLADEDGEYWFIRQAIDAIRALSEDPNE